jgi:hypothetical protein
LSADCRHWRELVDDRTTEMQSRAKLLIWDTHIGERPRYDVADAEEDPATFPPDPP